MAGSVNSLEVAMVGEGCRFVEEHPIGNSVTQSLRDDLGVVGEAGRGIAIGPASGIFESLRQVPMVERDKRADTGFEQDIDEAAVEIDAFCVCRAGARRLDPRPGNRKAVAVQVHRSDERNVFAHALIRIAGDVAGIAILNFSGRMREAVPDGFALAIVFPGALDLVGGG